MKVELTAILPAKGTPITINESDQDLSHSGQQVLLEMAPESVGYGDEKQKIDESVKFQQELNSSVSVHSLPGIPIREQTSSSPSLFADDRMPGLIEENTETDPLMIFLNSLDITAEDLERLNIPVEPLRQLFQQETSGLSWLKWCRFERVMENALHGLLLSRRDLELNPQKVCLSARVRPHEYSILLHHRSSLRKAYAASELLLGVRLGIFGFVRIFIVAMLLYRLGAWASSGERDFSAFESIFSANNQKGIDSLTGLLAQLQPSLLRFILSAPLLLGGVQSLLEFATASQDSQEKTLQRINTLATYLQKSPGWRKDVIEESIPLFSHLFSVSRQIRLLTQSLNWNGQLTSESRLNTFAMIRQVTQRGRKVPQWTALACLAQLAQGIGFKDFPRLKAIGYDKTVLAQLLFIKAHAFADLISFSQKYPGESAIKIAPRRLLANFWLWWLGQSISSWWQRLPFFSLKIGTLMLEIYFFYNIASSLVKAIHCPDKPGFQLGDGYLPWASDYSPTCFTRRIEFFNPDVGLETLSQFLLEILNYHLTDLVSLILGCKSLTPMDVQSIIQAINVQGAVLQSLDLGDSCGETAYPNILNYLPLDFFTGLETLRYLSMHNASTIFLPPGIFSNLTQLQYLDLSSNLIHNLSAPVLNGLTQLQSLNLADNPLGNLSANVFASLGQLQALDISYSQVDDISSHLFTGLNQLNLLNLAGNPLNYLSPNLFVQLPQLRSLDLSNTQLKYVLEGAFNGLTQLRYLNLAYNFLTDLPVNLLSGLSQLESLDLYGNLFNTSAMMDILMFLPPTVTSFNISSNAIQNFSMNLSGLWPPALQILSIGGNPAIPATISSTWINDFPTQLTYFSLAESLIINISTSAFANFRQLRSLNLSYNTLNNWSSNILLGLNQLQTLDLSNNTFNALSAFSFAGVPNLQSLKMSNNPIAYFAADAFSGLGQLQQLDLSSVIAGDLPPNLFASLTQLQSLVIINNPFLFSLPEGLLANLSHLQFLDFSGNNLFSLPAGLFTQQGELQLLNLSSNQIIQSPAGVFSGLDQLKILDIRFNPLDSDWMNNISIHFPYQINEFVFSTNSRNGTVYGIDQANFIINLTPCLTQLNTFLLYGNVNEWLVEIGLSNALQLYNRFTQQILKNVCEEQLCHANLSPQDLCHPLTISNSQTVASSAYSNRFLRQSLLSALPYFKGAAEVYFPNNSLTPDSSPIVAAGISHSSAADHLISALSTPAAVGASILGVTGLSILLYRNSTWIKAIVDTGCWLMQRCWEKTTPAKTFGRYTLFARSCSPVKTTLTPAISSKTENNIHYGVG